MLESVVVKYWQPYREVREIRSFKEKEKEMDPETLQKELNKGLLEVLGKIKFEGPFNWLVGGSVSIHVNDVTAVIGRRFVFYCDCGEDGKHLFVGTIEGVHYDDRDPKAVDFIVNTPTRIENREIVSISYGNGVWEAMVSGADEGRDIFGEFKLL